MKWNNTFLHNVLIILKYGLLNLCRTNVRCWFGHNYEDTMNTNIKKT